MKNKLHSENTSTLLHAIDSDLAVIKEMVYDQCGYELSNLLPNAESNEYSACSFRLDDKVILHRRSKITPTKTGQFVTLWKRNHEGITKPYAISDNIDFIIITLKKDAHLGQFIFPVSVLADKGVLTKNGKEGKRGIRVYSPWDEAMSEQAQKTKQWQGDYFFKIEKEGLMDLLLIKKRFTL